MIGNWIVLTVLAILALVGFVSLWNKAEDYISMKRKRRERQPIVLDIPQPSNRAVMQEMSRQMQDTQKMLADICAQISDRIRRLDIDTEVELGKTQGIIRKLDERAQERQGVNMLALAEIKTALDEMKKPTEEPRFMGARLFNDTGRELRVAMRKPPQLPGLETPWAIDISIGKPSVTGPDCQRPGVTTTTMPAEKGLEIYPDLTVRETFLYNPAQAG